ncbi:7-cyano-7-deazaguanine synthase QueC [Actinosynnema sp. NPDC047251]|uniref:7-cyano-7-deazaguanine synthase n=1 Tax=Saccharothrix espanaensis (strain ATCC 51144 / DSM 44229 / JCM 9112 / NBRC 15066 / NRRL 15764) TaxID=1179773 RepID=K0JYS9_SACES|nr:7-cyano-7-deazaguanine synthase QueC [Saccharothrix espanaensis]CCH29403.1 7-cyano-7-deazaguanine synthase [Saccharothrix espanaensis DSM 44229]
MARRAIVLLSGGLDSCTVLAIAKDQGFESYALSFDYGQRHRTELRSAGLVAAALGATEHRTATIDLRVFGGSALTSDVEVPKHRIVDDIDSNIIPVTYVPARNTIFLAFATAYAEVVGAFDIFTGVTAVDYSGYPDCRPEFMEAFEATANLGTRAGVEQGERLRLHSPLIEMSKADIIREGTRLGVDYSLTSSCYDPDDRGRACGHCDTCLLRLKGFAECGIKDPVAYRGAVA